MNTILKVICLILVLNFSFSALALEATGFASSISTTAKILDGDAAAQDQELRVVRDDAIEFYVDGTPSDSLIQAVKKLREEYPELQDQSFEQVVRMILEETNE